MQHCQGLCKPSFRSYSLNSPQRKQAANTLRQQEQAKINSHHQQTISIHHNSKVYYEDQLALLRDYYHRQLGKRDLQICKLQENLQELQQAVSNKKSPNEKKLMTIPMNSHKNEELNSLNKNLIEIRKNENELPKFNQTDYQTKIKNMVNFVKSYKQKCKQTYSKQKVEFKDEILKLKKKIFEKDQIISNLQKDREIEAILRDKLAETRSCLEQKQERIQQLQSKQNLLLNLLEKQRDNYQQLKITFNSYKQNSQKQQQSSDKQLLNKIDAIVKKIQNQHQQQDFNNEQVNKIDNQTLLIQKEELELMLNLNIQKCSQLNITLDKKQQQIENLKQRIIKFQHKQKINKPYEVDNKKLKDKSKWKKNCRCPTKQQNIQLREKIGQFETLLKLQNEQKGYLTKRLEEKNLSESQQIKYITQLQCENQALKRQIDAMKKQLDLCYVQQKKIDQQLVAKQAQKKLFVLKIEEVEFKLRQALQQNTNTKKQYLTQILDKQEAINEKEEFIKLLENQNRTLQNQIRQLQRKFDIQLDRTYKNAQNKHNPNINYPEKLAYLQEKLKSQQHFFQSSSYEQQLVIQRANYQTYALRQEIQTLTNQNQYYMVEIQRLSQILDMKNKYPQQCQLLNKKNKISDEENLSGLFDEINSEKIQDKKSQDKKDREMVEKKLLEAKENYQAISRLNLQCQQTIKIQENWIESCDRQNKQLIEKIRQLQTIINQTEEANMKEKAQLEQKIKLYVSENEVYRLNLQKERSQWSDLRKQLEQQIESKDQYNKKIKEDCSVLWQQLQEKQSQIQEQKVIYLKQLQQKQHQHQKHLQQIQENYYEQRADMKKSIEQLEEHFDLLIQEKKDKKKCHNSPEISTSSKTKKISQISQQQEIIYYNQNDEVQQLKRAYQNAKKTISEYENKYPKLMQKYQAIRQKWIDYCRSIGEVNLDDYLIHSESESFIIDQYEEDEMLHIDNVQVQESIIVKSTNQQILIQQDPIVQAQLIGGRIRKIQMQQSIIYEEENEDTTTKKQVTQQQLQALIIPPNIKRKLPDVQDNPSYNFDQNSNLLENLGVPIGQEQEQLKFQQNMNVLDDAIRIEDEQPYNDQAEANQIEQGPNKSKKNKKRRKKNK